jgi:hypothetical protein
LFRSFSVTRRAPPVGRHSSVGGCQRCGRVARFRHAASFAGAPLRHPYLRAGVIHDHYCHLARALPPGTDRDALRLGADMLFREMVDAIAGCRAAASGAGGSRAARMSAWVRRAMRPVTSRAYYRAVRMGAWTSRRAAQWPNYALHPAEHLAAWTAEM